MSKSPSYPLWESPTFPNSACPTLTLTLLFPVRKGISSRTLYLVFLLEGPGLLEGNQHNQSSREWTVISLAGVRLTEIWGACLAGAELSLTVNSLAQQWLHSAICFFSVHCVGRDFSFHTSFAPAEWCYRMAILSIS